MDGGIEKATFNGLCFTAPGLQMKAKTGVLWAPATGHKAQ